MLRKDGNYTIYIIKHLYKKEGDKWANSGDCGQWLAQKIKKLFIDDNDDRSVLYNNTHKSLFNKFNASGECWQITGISGTYNVDEAITLCNIIASWFPEHSFKVCKLEIKQTTSNIAQFDYSQI